MGTSHFKLPVWWHWERPLIKTFVSLSEAFRSVNGTWHRREKRICPNQSSLTWRDEDACGPGWSLMNPPLSLDFWGACASTGALGEITALPTENAVVWIQSGKDYRPAVLGRLLTNCGPLLITDYIMKSVVIKVIWVTLLAIMSILKCNIL